MRRILWLLGGTVAVALTVIAVYVATTLPPPAQRFQNLTRDPRLIWGAYHVHSNRSDGSGTPDEIAAAAARAGLQFVIFTDHGDATGPAAPEYLHGVLCIDAAEINTEQGHLVALNLQQRAPYPLAGEARDVIEDIHRLGGWAVAAHPESPRPELRWRAQGLPVDGFEWLNLDSEWRGQTTNALAADGLRALIRGPETIGSMLKQGSGVVERWDRARQSAFSLAGLDAHARLGSDSGNARGAGLAFPRYETIFRAVAQAVTLSDPMSGDAASDARRVLDAIGGGQSFTVVRAFADVLTPVEFWASTPSGRVNGFGALADDHGTMHVMAGISALNDVEIALLRDGRRILSGRHELRYDGPVTPGRYRMEAFVAGHAFPWLVTNAIDVGGRSQPKEPPSPERDTGRKDAVQSSAWAIEKDHTSTATIDASPDGVRLRYTLGAGTAAGQYAAVAAPAGSEPVERIELSVRSTSPMRISLQVRAPGGPEGRRWRRSLYVDGTPRAISVKLADLDPVERGSVLRPVIARLQSVLIVVDTVNTLPGTSGEVTISGVRLVRGSAAAETGKRP